MGAKGKRKGPEGGTPRRLFTDDFKLGQRVSVIRTEHGWFDGRLLAEIVHLTADSCQVAEIERGRPVGCTHDILKPRDIRPA